MKYTFITKVVSEFLLLQHMNPFLSFFPNMATHPVSVLAETKEQVIHVYIPPFFL